MSDTLESHAPNRESVITLISHAFQKGYVQDETMPSAYQYSFVRQDEDTRSVLQFGHDTLGLDVFYGVFINETGSRVLNNWKVSSTRKLSQVMEAIA